MAKKLIIKKTCSNCSYLKKNLCKNSKAKLTKHVCNKWLPIATSCLRCLSLRQCILNNIVVNENFVCHKFSRNKFPPNSIDALRKEVENSSRIIDSEEDKDIFSPVSMVDSIISSNFDSKAFELIDDSCIPRAKNDIDFLLNEEFLGIDLFPKQLKVALEFFNCYCPFCSDVNFLINDIEVNTPVDEILDRVVLYNRKGKCPKCKKTKYQAYKKKKLDLHNNMVGICGQRSGKCLSFDTIIPSLDGLLKIKEFAKKAPYGFSNLEKTLVDEYGNLVKTSKFYKETKKKTITVRMDNGYEIKGTRNHPIYTLNGFIKLKNLTGNEDIPLFSGQEVWGKTLINLKSISDEIDISCKKQFMDKNLAKFLGLFISEGNNKGITNKDTNLLKHIENTLIQLFGKNSYYYENNGTQICWRDKKIETFLEILISKKVFYGKKVKQEIPLCIRQAPKFIIIAYLKALFENNVKIENTKITYYSLSKTLIYQISAILHNLGILHKIRNKKQVEKECYFIVIEGKNVFKYAENIGFISKYKKIKLKFVISYIKNKQIDMSYWDSQCPNSFLIMFYTIIDKVKVILPNIRYYGKELSMQQLYKVYGVDKLKRMKKDNIKLSKRTIIFFLKPLLTLPEIKFYLDKETFNNINYLYDFAESNLAYTTVKSIRPNKKESITYDFTVPKHHKFMANGLLNHNSALTAIFSALITYKYLTLKDPYEEFFPGILKNTILHGTFVGLTFGQAFDTLWQPYYELVTSTNWFKTYNNFLKDKGEKIGKELVKLKDTFFIWHHRGATVYCSGPNKKTLRGRTRFLSACDEIGWFFGGKDSVKFNPDEVFEALDNSLMTVLSGSKRIFKNKPFTPLAYGLYISSPSSKTDKGMRMYNQSKTSKTIYGFHAPTWEFNPNITKKDLADKFRQDPIKAERDFGANPPHSSSPYISNPASILGNFKKFKNYFKYRSPKIVKDSLDAKLLAPRIKFRKKHNYSSILAIDNGLNNNSFACVLMHLDDNENDIIKITGLIEMIPDPYPLSYPDIYNNIIVPILDNFYVTLVVFDQWQSINLSQNIYKDYGIDAIRYSLNYDELDNVRTKLLSEDYKFPRTDHVIDDLINMNQDLNSLITKSPVSHIFLQLLLIHDTGRQVIKGDECTDDIFRAFALGSTLLTHPSYDYLFDDIGSEVNSIKSVSDMVVLINKSNPNIGKNTNNFNIGAGGSSICAFIPKSKY